MQLLYNFRFIYYYVLIYIYYIFVFIYFQLEHIVIKYTDKAPEKTKEGCSPGSPYMNFSTKSTLPIYMSNPQIYSGLFELSIKVSFAADTTEDIVSYIVKKYKHINGI